MRVRLTVLLACVAGVLTAAGPAQAVIGGEDDAGAHPFVGLALGPLPQPSMVCTGTLVSPRVFVTAAHCFPSGSMVVLSFSGTVAASGPWWMPGVVFNHPGFAPSGGVGGLPVNDLAVVRLLAPLPLPTATLPSAGMTDGLAVGTSLTQVGYGVQGWAEKGTTNPKHDGLRPEDSHNDPEPYPNGPPLTRMKAQTELVSAGKAAADGLLKVSASRTAACYGDSGGPSLLGTTVVAAHSGSRNRFCNGVSYATRLDTASALAFVRSFLP